MLTRPLGISNVDWMSRSTYPLQPSQFKDFCLKADAEAMCEKMKALLPSSSFSVIDLDANGGMYDYRGVQEGGPRYYGIRGTVQLDNGEQVLVDEIAGSLVDRETKPNAKPGNSVSASRPRATASSGSPWSPSTSRAAAFPRTCRTKLRA